MTLSSKQPREQSGRDSFSRYRSQVRSAAMATLSILEGKDVDRVYCDLHDDFVVRINDNLGVRYTFYQVKTKGKQNHIWTINEIFGLKTTLKDPKKQNSESIKDSFVGKLLRHTVIFADYCDAVVFQTNVNCCDEIDEILSDISSDKFEAKYTKVLVERFNNIFVEDKSASLPTDIIKKNLAKLLFQSDVQYLKESEDNFEPLARDKIYKFSEVDLTHDETVEISLKLLDLVEKKSSGVIKDWTTESIEKLAGISIDDLLLVLSISKDAYYCLVQGGDTKAIRSASIIQRTLASSGADSTELEYCSRCKIEWDQWYRNNRHIIPYFDLNRITSMIKVMLIKVRNNGIVSIPILADPIISLISELSDKGLLYDLDRDLILGGVFAELVRGKA